MLTTNVNKKDLEICILMKILNWNQSFNPALKFHAIFQQLNPLTSQQQSAQILNMTLNHKHNITKQQIIFPTPLLINYNNYNNNKKDSNINNKDSQLNSIIHLKLYHNFQSFKPSFQINLDILNKKTLYFPFLSNQSHNNTKSTNSQKILQIKSFFQQSQHHQKYIQLQNSKFKNNLFNHQNNHHHYHYLHKYPYQSFTTNNYNDSSKSQSQSTPKSHYLSKYLINNNALNSLKYQNPKEGSYEDTKKMNTQRKNSNQIMNQLSKKYQNDRFLYRKNPSQHLQFQNHFKATHNQRPKTNNQASSLTSFSQYGENGKRVKKSFSDKMIGLLKQIKSIRQNTNYDIKRYQGYKSQNENKDIKDLNIINKIKRNLVNSNINKKKAYRTSNDNNDDNKNDCNRVMRLNQQQIQKSDLNFNRNMHYKHNINNVNYNRKHNNKETMNRNKIYKNCLDVQSLNVLDH